jgi:tetratricopeptide (TPR) repeat protein
MASKKDQRGAAQADSDGANRRLSYTEARRNLKNAPNPRWSQIAPDFAGGVWPVVTPSFKLKGTDTIFTIGSCFARNVEEHVARLGCRVPMLDFSMPPHEWRGAANSAMNKFNPPAFPQILEWVGKISDRDGIVTWDDCRPFALDCAGGEFFDMDMGATPHVSRERFVERRQHIYDIFSTVFSADCLMMTPGLIEAWRDTETGLFTHEGPVNKAMSQHQSRFQLEILTYQQCEAAFLRAIDAVRLRNPRVKVLMTTSPVPLSATFSGQDVRIANTYSKSMLRAVCGSLPMQRPMLDYFPSYESVTLSHPDDVWQSDRLHVGYGFVGRIVEHLISSYFEDVDASNSLFQQAVSALAAGDNQQGEEALRAAILLRPDFVKAQALLADTRTSSGDYEGAAADLERILARHPEDVAIRLTLARALIHMKQRCDEGYELIKATCALDSLTYSQMRQALRMVALAPVEIREQVGRQGVSRFPLHAAVYQTLTEALEDLGDVDGAIELLRRGVALHKPPVELYIQLARLLSGQGETAEAMAYAVTARGVAATHPGVVAVLAALGAT